MSARYLSGARSREVGAILSRYAKLVMTPRHVCVRARFEEIRLLTSLPTPPLPFPSVVNEHSRLARQEGDMSVSTELPSAEEHLRS